MLKRYSLQDVEPSGAYDLHADPEIYSLQRIALVSLSGPAELTVQLRSGEQYVFDCLPGTALFVAPDLLHAITPPLNEDGNRHFLFLGYDKTLEPTE